MKQMTPAQLKRAAELLHARDAIREFLSARDKDSEFVKAHLNSRWDHEREEGRKLPKASVVDIQINDADRCDTAGDTDPDTLASWYIPRDILECGLRATLPSIDAELTLLGVTEGKSA
jgi:hypothetical protein